MQRMLNSLKYKECCKELESKVYILAVLVLLDFWMLQIYFIGNLHIRHTNSL